MSHLICRIDEFERASSSVCQIFPPSYAVGMAIAKTGWAPEIWELNEGLEWIGSQECRHPNNEVRKNHASPCSKMFRGAQRSRSLRLRGAGACFVQGRGQQTLRCHRAGAAVARVCGGLLDGEQSLLSTGRRAQPPERDRGSMHRAVEFPRILPQSAGNGHGYYPLRIR